jgi:hypothetical protein
VERSPVDRVVSEGRAVRVWNKRQSGIPDEAVYVGRPTPWGNPFQIGPDGTREQVIQLYRDMLKDRPDVIAKAKKELRGKDLVCWCAPQPCHADVLMEVANS